MSEIKYRSWCKNDSFKCNEYNSVFYVKNGGIFCNYCENYYKNKKKCDDKTRKNVFISAPSKPKRLFKLKVHETGKNHKIAVLNIQKKLNNEKKN
jgi:uncharacterized Zn finger protein (UPF0148 family)